jgi:tetratricopeptide (TPR) repeat protein
MKHYVKLFTALSAGAGSLLGCSQFALGPTDASPRFAYRTEASSTPKVTPVNRTVSAVSEAEGFFIMGRAAHGQGQLALAEEQYAKALSLQPTHVGALNAIAVICAQTERHEQAHAYFRRALAADPQAAHVHNNLGYALMIAGRLSEAEVAFKQAQALNPSSALTLKNRDLLAQSKKREETLAGVNGATPAPTPTSPPTAVQVSKVATPTGPQLLALAPHVYELRDAAPRAGSPVHAQAPAPTQTPLLAFADKLETKVAVAISSPIASKDPVVSTSLQGIKIEVSNGVGIRNLARRTAERLAPLGVVTARLTNQPGYKQTKTEIFYSTGQMGAAQALSAKLPIAAQVLAANDLGTRVQMRLVLGRDVDVKALAQWLDGLDVVAPVVALNRFEGWLWS